MTAVPTASTGIDTVFTAYSGPLGQNGWLELWRTDGSGAGPEKLSSFVSPNPSDPLTVFNGAIYFVGQNGELWKTDGTPGGTQSIPGISGAHDLTVAGGSLYLATGNALDPSSTLFKYDGSTVTEIGGGSLHPDRLYAAGDALFVTSSAFMLNPDGSMSPTLEPGQLYKVDASGVHIVPPSSSSDWTVVAPGPLADVVGTGGALYSIAVDSFGIGSSSNVFRATENGVDQFTLNSVYNPSNPSGGSPLYAQHLYAGNGVVYVLADDGFGNGRTLFVVDGSGATQISSPDAAAGIGNPLLLDTFNAQPTVVDGVLYFAAHEVVADNGPIPGGPQLQSPTELYKLDGQTVVQVTGGATGIGDLGTGMASHGHYYFTAAGNSGLELFRVDANGATSIATLGQTSVGGGEVLEADGKVFFTDFFANSAGAQGGSHLWVATAGGSPTLLVGVDQGVGLISGLSYENGKLVFSAYDDAHGQELWASDGTPAGTGLATDLSAGIDPSAPVQMDHTAAADGHFYFTTHDALGNESLWTTDGSIGSTREIVLPSGFQLESYTQPIAVGDAVYFYAWSVQDGNGFFKADQNGVSLLGSNTAGLESISSPVAVGNALYFTAVDANGSTELFKSDAGGVTEITHAAGQFTPTTYQMVEANGATYFFGNSQTGQHLYKLSGGIVSEVMNGTREIASPSNLTNNEGALYFTGDDGSGNGFQVFKADPNGVSQVSHVTDGIATNDVAVAGGTVYYVDSRYYNSAGSNQYYPLYKAVESSAVQVSSNGVSYASDLTSIGGVLYLEAQDSSGAEQLYKVGANGFQEITGGSTGLSFPDSQTNHLLDVGGVLYFWAKSNNDGGTTQLFKYDGTLSAVTGGATGLTEPSGFVTANGQLYFKAFTQSALELQIFKADAGGVVQLTTGAHNFSGLYNSPIVASGNDIYYQAPDGANGIELWRVDTTTGDSVRLTDTELPNSSIPANFVTFNNSLAIDGYISGATVFDDANNDGVWEPGEAKTTTDASGQFSLTGGSGPLVLEGGVDTVTGLPFTGHLTAPSGYSVVTPLTTLVNALLPQNPTPAQVSSAETAVLHAFNIGLGVGQTLGTLDPEAGAKAGDPASTAALVAGVQVYDTVAMLSSALQGAGLGSEAATMNAVVQAIATKISSAAGGAVDLSNATVVAGALAAAVQTLDPGNAQPLDPAFSGGVVNVVTASNSALNQSIADDPSHALLHAGAAALVAQGATTAALSNPGAISQTVTDYTGTKLSQAVSNAQADVNVTCFMPGTLIRTPSGEVPVEALVRGDLVMTVDGKAMPVTWLGRQTISRLFSDPLRVLPIRIRAGALGDNVPARDFLVSPDHALLVDEVLIQAGALVNGTSIVRETNVPQVFTYYHVELDDHSLILAENTPAETFVDNVNRLNFDNWAEHEALYPEGKPIVEMPYPRADAHRQVPRKLREEIAVRGDLLYGEDARAVA